MPWNYVLKCPNAYTEDTVKAALWAIQDGLSVFKASKEFGVPFETLRGRHTNLHNGVQGRPKQLIDQEEEDIAHANSIFVEKKTFFRG